MHKSGFINIIGNPNVGKSTLMNNLVGEKLSIITSKAQTTRHRILGIVNGDNFQLIFSDTPGIIKPSYELQDSMMDFVKSALEDADVILYMVEIGEKAIKNSDVHNKIQSAKVPTIILLNKIDLSNQEEIESLFDCSIENALLKASDKAFISICTQGRHGSTLCKEGKFIKSNAFKINVKDTTGAGDNFAAGFLHGYINNYSLSKCSELGNYCAAETVKVIGARPDSNIKELLEKNKILEN